MLEQYKEGDVVTLNQSPFINRPWSEDDEFEINEVCDGLMFAFCKGRQGQPRIGIIKQWIKEKVEK